MNVRVRRTLTRRGKTETKHEQVKGHPGLPDGIFQTPTTTAPVSVRPIAHLQRFDLYFIFWF